MAEWWTRNCPSYPSRNCRYPEMNRNHLIPSCPNRNHGGLVMSQSRSCRIDRNFLKNRWNFLKNPRNPTGRNPSYRTDWNLKNRIGRNPKNPTGRNSPKSRSSSLKNPRSRIQMTRIENPGLHPRLAEVILLQIETNGVPFACRLICFPSEQESFPLYSWIGDRT